MTKTMRGTIVAATMLLAGAGSVAAQQAHTPAPPSPRFNQPQPFAWWKSDSFKKELGLTADQSARIDRIWETTRPELRQEWAVGFFRGRC